LVVPVLPFIPDGRLMLGDERAEDLSGWGGATDMTARGISISKTIGRTLYMACVLGLVANIGAAIWHIGFPQTAPAVMADSIQKDEPAYLTGSLGAWRGSLPRARSVDVVKRIVVEGVAAPAEGVWAGQFDPITGDIQVIAGAGDLTLAHEYGHALLLDLIVERVGPGAGALAAFQGLSEMDRGSDPSSAPEWLRGMFAEYKRLRADPYGDSYYGSSFNEYFAESFAWTADRDGMDVAPITLAFFACLDRASR
jgi:hypothetical protein